MRKLNGRTVRLVREKSGISLRSLARSIECNPGYLSRLENGTRQGTPAVIARIAESLGVDVDAITYPSERAA